MFARNHNTLSEVSVAVAVASSTEIPFQSYSGGIVYVPVGSSLTTITWYVASKPGGTYTEANDEDGQPVVQTVAAGKAYAIPSALFAAAGLKAVGDAAETVAMSLKG